MSDVDDDFDSDDDTGSTSTKGNALRDQNSKLNKQLQDALAELQKLQVKERQVTIADALREKGANPKLAKYVNRDLEGDVTAEAVAKWLEDEGELFGYQPTDADDDADAEQQERVAAATAGAKAPQTGWTPEKIKGMSDQQLIDAGLLDPR